MPVYAERFPLAAACRIGRGIDRHAVTGEGFRQKAAETRFSA
jgi:hypothetical protein